MKVLSVVCARAGSKGLQNKCMARIGEKRVIEYAIEYSLSLGEHVKTVISTDIEELIAYCEHEGIVYIRREPALCTDESKIDDALADALEKEGEDCQLCSLVYGSIPTRYPQLLHDAVDFLAQHPDYEAVLSMENVEKYHPAWMFDYHEDVLPHVTEVSYRRQGLPQKMTHIGHTFLFRRQEFYERYTGIRPYDKSFLYSIFGTKIKPMLTDKLIIDIDTAKDLSLVRAVLLNPEEF